MQTTARHIASSASFAHPHRNIGALRVEPGMKVADFGAGSGAYVLALAEAMAGSGHVYAIDVQRDLLRRIKTEADARGFQNVNVLWGDLEVPGGSKIADASLDLVLISNLLFQVEEKANVLAEAKRVVRSRGKVAVIDWTDSFRGMGPHKNDVVRKEEALALARGEGLELIREFPAGAHHYGLLFRVARIGAQ